MNLVCIRNTCDQGGKWSDFSKDRKRFALFVLLTLDVLVITASQHSGTVDEREEDEEEESEVRCCVCDHPFTDVDKYVKIP